MYFLKGWKGSDYRSNFICSRVQITQPGAQRAPHCPLNAFHLHRIMANRRICHSWNCFPCRLWAPHPLQHAASPWPSSSRPQGSSTRLLHSSLVHPIGKLPLLKVQLGTAASGQRCQCPCQSSSPTPRPHQVRGLPFTRGPQTPRAGLYPRHPGLLFPSGPHHLCMHPLP